MPLVGEYSLVVDADRRIRLPADWTRLRQEETWLITPSFLDAAPTGAAGAVLVVMPASDLCRNHNGHENASRLTIEQALKELRTAARGKGLAEEVATTFDWLANQSLLTLASAQLDWLGCRERRLVLVGLLTKAHLMTPETRRVRVLALD